MPSDKKQLTEQEIRSQFISPAVVDVAGWNLNSQVREEYPIQLGKIKIKGKNAYRAKAGKADYVLFYKPNIPIAVIEAKDNRHTPGEGMQQALRYGEAMDVPFVYSTNGDRFVEHDRFAKDRPPERELKMDEFPTPWELWERFKQYKSLTGEQERIYLHDYYMDRTGKKPWYYQLTAINRVTEAIAKGQKRILLVMATGTGKTYTAFQIAWRLWKAKKKKRILFLADRNALIDQTMENDFKPFGNVLHRIKNRSIEKAFEVYMALYQSMCGPEEEKNVYKKFSPDFFDLIIVDECHRGSVKDDSEWREILEYFSSAVQIGLTATPKETEYESNISYFGEPLFTYSLKQGIEDGYLAPYKVIRVVTDKDDGWRPERGQLDKYGELIPDKVYNLNDFDRQLVLEHRIKVVARRVTEFLRQNGEFSKTIIFCQDISHAEQMRGAMVNENPALSAENRRYIVRITGDSEERDQDLYDFNDVTVSYPVVAVTSKLMSTGVDSKACKLIVLERPISSMTEFKQIIGRGTRVREDVGKMFFTIMDFRRVTNLFSDPEFDGEPVQVYEPGPGDPVTPPGDLEPADAADGNTQEPAEYPNNPGSGKVGMPEPDYGSPRPPHNRRKKYYVDGVPVRIINERVQYTGPDGKLITESMRSYCRKSLRGRFKSLDHFLEYWSEAEKKAAIIEELENHGIMLTELMQEVGVEFDVFDLVCHVAFDMKPMTRRERTTRIKPADLEKYSETARKVLQTLIDKYANQGVASIENIRTLSLPAFQHFGSFVEIIAAFGGKEGYLNAVKELENKLYDAA